MRFESLERRDMMSGNYIYSITSGQTVSFTDADGTKVKVKLMGSGSGSFTLTNGLQNGAPINAMTITGTDSTSQLKITAAGGGDDVSTIRTLTVTPTIPGPALTQFNTTAINVASGGLFTFNGGVGSMMLNNVNNGGAIVVNGGLNSAIINAVGSSSSIDVTGTLNSLKVTTLGNGNGLAEVNAQTLTSLSVTGQMNDALVSVGSGGLLTAYVGSATNASIASAGNIGSVTVQGAVQNAGIAANRSAGSDGMLGTIDDYTINSAAAGLISSVTFNGWIAAGSSNLQVITTGAAPTVGGTSSSLVDVIDNAISQYVPLDISQAVANATGFDDDEIWIALYGYESVNGPTYFLDASSLNPASGGGQPTPRPVATSTLSTGTNTADQAILPSSTIGDWANASSQWLSNLQMPVPPRGKHFTGRILISVGAPVQAQITAANGTVAAPSASNPLDPSTGTFYDFLEFTVTNSKHGVVNVDINTSQIDSFGLPMTMQLYQDAAGTDSFTQTFTGTPTSGSTTIANVSSLTGLQVGQIVSGTGIGPGSMITSMGTVSNVNFITLSLAATPSATGSPTQISALIGGPVGIDSTVTRHELFDPNDSSSLTNYLQAQITAGNDYARPFLQSTAPFAINSSQPITSVDNPGSGGPIVVTVSSVGGLRNGDVVEISGVTSIANANGYFVVSNVTGTTFTLENSAGGVAANFAGGVWTGYATGPRLVSPKDIVEALTSASSTNPLNNYYNEAIDAFFLKYFKANDPVVPGGGGETFSITSTASGSLLTYTGQVQQVPGLGYVLLLNSSAPASPNKKPFAIFYPFITNANLPAGYTPKFPTVDAPTWLVQQNMQNQSPSQMIFACDAFFADNVFRLNYYQGQGIQFTPTWSAELADLENSIASAFNRGVALEAPSTWGDETQWYQQGNQYNFWAEYWHDSGVTIDTLSYAYPYDDKYGRSTTLNVNNVGLIEVSLGTWSTTQESTTTSFTTFPTTANQQGSVTLTANVTPATNLHSPTGTVMFFIDGVPINSSNSGTSPPVQPIAVDGSGNATITATLPPLPDGSVTHTYAVTAVYSGDQYTAPSVASQPLKLTGVNGDFLMGVTPLVPNASFTPNSKITVNTTLPGGIYNGTLAYWMGSNLLGVVDVGGDTISTVLTIPASIAPGLTPITATFTPLSGGPYNATVSITVVAS